MKLTIDQQNRAIRKAMSILEERMRYAEVTLTSPGDVKDYLLLTLSEEKQEVFSVLFLDNRHQLISFDRMFYGTIDGASVYPREVVRKVIEYNAAAVIFAHNHPSGVSTPSEADIRITNRLRDALALIDVRVLDHIIVGNTSTSLAETGRI